jgi:glycerol-3-phosphate acyltransferase PlsY
VTLALWLVASYVLGSLPTSYLAAKYGAGIDLREVGSKSLGATNVYRILGWRYAIPVGVIDMAKGAIPVLLFAPRAGTAAWIPLATGTAAVLGHVFSAFVRFRGGKGVATAAGVVVALQPAALGLAAIVWVGVLLATRIVSVASIASAVAFPLTVWIVDRDNVWVLGAGSALALFIVFTHRSNLRRLLDGTEHRFGRRGSA